jgi:3-oxoacyl-[acyl-carrier protein] reductase
MGDLLKKQVALVTGGSRGLGRAICKALAMEGAHVAFNYLKSDKNAEELVKNIKKLDVKCWAFKVSVLDKKGLNDMVKELEQETGNIDILINNAGLGQVVPLALMEEEDWDNMMDTNVKGAFLTTQAVMRSMIRAKSGRILNISSLAGVKMMLAPVHYCAAKAALKGFTEGLAKEIGRFGVTVNCLAPGILTEGISNNVPDDKKLEYLSHCAIKRFGTLEEVAEVATFMVSRKNSYMNGATVVLDGGV